MKPRPETCVTLPMKRERTKVLTSVGLAMVGWVVLGSLVEAHRDANHREDPLVVAVVEADLASRRCPGLRLDIDQFRRISANLDMNHSDFFNNKRSAETTARLDTLRKNLHATKEQTCGALWSAYGPSGWKASLLRRG